MRIEQVSKLKSEIMTLEKRLTELKQELSSLQQNCDHQFERKTFVRVCQNCGYSDSTLW
ncbi:serine protease [Bacillus sp. Hm123]|uniref:serine protease n=1 Tax=Bacillus sp. Hm123 TaxID=3450745 RepID=UPI003F42CD57